MLLPILVSALIGIVGGSVVDERLADPAAQTTLVSATEAVSIQARTVTPADGIFLLLRSKGLASDEQPRPYASCDEIYHWLVRRDFDDVGQSRIVLRLQAMRLIQAAVAGISVQTSHTQYPISGVYARCVPEDYFEHQQVALGQICPPQYEGTGLCPPAPVFALAQGRLEFFDPNAATPLSPGRVFEALADLTFFLESGSTFDIPIRVVGVQDLDVHFVIKVDLIINGKPVHLRVDNRGRPFTIRGAFREARFDPPTHLWFNRDSKRFSSDPWG